MLRQKTPVYASGREEEPQLQVCRQAEDFPVSALLAALRFRTPTWDLPLDANTTFPDSDYVARIEDCRCRVTLHEQQIGTHVS